MSERRMRTVAIALACAALALAVAATVIVVRRHSPVIEATVSASVVTKLVPGSFEDAAPGVRVRDASLARSLGLDDNDVLVSLAGVPLRSVGDLVPAMASVAPAATVLYAELARGVVVRWTIEPRRATANDPLAGSIHAIDDLHVVVPRKTADVILGDPLAAGRALRFAPLGTGYRISSIPPGSIADVLGLRDGDVIRSINGFEISTPEQALDVYAAMRDATEITVDLVRRGRPITLRIDVGQ